MRERLGHWLTALLPDPGHVYDLLLAAGEACTNAVEHGHHSDRRPIRLEATADATTIRITIHDNGTWIPPTPGTGDPLRGRGLELIAALVDEARVSVDGSGTTVELVALLPAA